MLVADYTGHNVLRIDMQSRAISVYAHEQTMNQPNDIAIAADDTVYASDPNWAESTGQIWRIDGDGQAHVLDPDMGTTNGIEVSPDEKTLYVNESVQRSVWAYDLLPDGTVANKRLLIQFPDFNMDGMRCDIDGNIYITRHGKGTVAKLSPEGEVLLRLNCTGEIPTILPLAEKMAAPATSCCKDRATWKPSAQSAPAEAGIYSTDLEQHAQRGRLLKSRGLWSRPSIMPQMRGK